MPTINPQLALLLQAMSKKPNFAMTPPFAPTPAAPSFTFPQNPKTPSIFRNPMLAPVQPAPRPFFAPPAPNDMSDNGEAGQAGGGVPAVAPPVQGAGGAGAPLPDGAPVRANFLRGIGPYQDAPAYQAPTRNLAGERRSNIYGLAGTLLGSILSGHGANFVPAATGYYNGAKGQQDEAAQQAEAQAQNDYTRRAAQVNAANQNVTRQTATAESAYDDAATGYRFDTEQKRLAKAEADRLLQQKAVLDAATGKAADAQKQKAENQRRATLSAEVNEHLAALKQPGAQGLADTKGRIARLEAIKKATGIGPGSMAYVAPDFTPQEKVTNAREAQNATRQQANADRNYGLSADNNALAHRRFNADETRYAAKMANGGFTPNEAESAVRNYNNSISQGRKQQTENNKRLNQLANVQKSGTAVGLNDLLKTGLPELVPSDPNNPGSPKIPRKIGEVDQPMINEEMTRLNEENKRIEAQVQRAAARRQSIAGNVSGGVRPADPYGPGVMMDKTRGIPLPAKSLNGPAAPRPAPAVGHRMRTVTAPTVYKRKGGGTITVTPL